MNQRGSAIPLNGEIISDARQGSADMRVVGGDVVDADFEAVSSSSSPFAGLHKGGTKRAAPAAETEAPPTFPQAGMDMLKRQGLRSEATRGGIPFYAAGLAVAAMAFWVAGGHTLFSGLVPANGAVTSTKMLRLGGIATRTVSIGNKDYLIVSGHVRNDGSRAASSPPVRIAVTGLNGDIHSYRLGSQRTPISAGEIMPFSSRLDAPPSGVGSVLVTLAARSGQ